MARDKAVRHPMDVALGVQVRALRRDQGWSQQYLASLVGLTFQQMQKYETGANRISFSRMVEIANALGITVTEMIDPVVQEKHGRSSVVPHSGINKFMNDPLALRLLDAFSKAQKAGDKKVILKMVQSYVRS